MSKSNLHFIINPISGTGKQHKVLQKIKRQIDAKRFDTHIHYTEKEKHATEIAKRLCKEKNNIIIAVGGDGTVNEIASTMVHSNNILGIIPTGSGNGLARHLKIPQNVDQSIALINKMHIEKIDSCHLNDHFFINIAGMGFDGFVSHEFAKAKKRGMKTYIKLILSKWWSYQMKKYEIEIDGKCIFQGVAAMVSCANGSQYGNNVLISPNSKLNDGWIELCILKPFRFYEVPKILLDLVCHRIHKNKKMKIIKCKSANIKCMNAKKHLDGEAKVLEDNIELKIYPKSINVLCN